MLDKSILEKLVNMKIDLLEATFPEQEKEEENTVYEFSSIPGNNHGCSGDWVKIVSFNDTIGIVINGGSCSSCWQVGHDDNSSPVPIGTIVELPCLDDVADLVGQFPGQKWSVDAPTFKKYEQAETVGDLFMHMHAYDTLSWEIASRFTGHSHNECIDDLDDPQPDTTLVAPEDLIVISDFLVPLVRANITVTEAAELAELTPRAIRAACTRGDINGAIKDGSHWSIPTRHLRHWLRNNRKHKRGPK